MSEFINNNQKRLDSLFEFSYGITTGKSGRPLFEQHQEAIEKVTPHDVINIVDLLVKKEIPIEQLKIGINKILNIFYKSLINYNRTLAKKGTFLDVLTLENNELIKRLENIRPLIKAFNKKDISDDEFKTIMNDLNKKILELNEFNLHYLKKENILFPYLEKLWEDYRCLPIMWSFHDDIRKNIKVITQLLSSPIIEVKKLNRSLGDLFFNMYAIKFREESIMFPVAMESVSDEAWNEMLDQSFEVGFCYIESPEKSPEKSEKIKTENLQIQETKNLDKFSDTILDFETGKITLQQAILLLNHLPVDITLVDENDEVRYFSKPKDRFFTRSKAIIGRKVHNCHPPESVHVVTDIVESFRSGKKDKETFWIQMKGKFVLIQYFALRDDNGDYKGTIEVSQDITEIRKLDGEKRLVDSIS